MADDQLTLFGDLPEAKAEHCAYCSVKRDDLVFCHVNDSQQVPMCKDCRGRHIYRLSYNFTQAAKVAGVPRSVVERATDQGLLKWHSRDGEKDPKKAVFVVEHADLVAWMATINKDFMETR